MDVSEDSGSANVAKALDRVTDRESFVAFVEALVEERELAEQLEREKPEYYKYGGALSWQNSTISSYLSAALNCVEDPNSLGEHISEVPSWRAFAEFLYMGKVWE
jgi:hypothetical protein